jgi:hypothetical protein
MMAGTKGHSGGARVGGGRPKKSEAARWLEGTAKATKVAGKPAQVAASTLMPAPSGLNLAEAAVWNELAPFALAARTLTPATAGDFLVLCRLEVEMADVLAERRVEGWSSKGLALAKEYRGLVQRSEAKRRAYSIGAMGRPIVEAAAEVVDPFAEFDQVVVQ